MSLYFNQITEPLLMQSYAILFFVSFIFCLVVIFPVATVSRVVLPLMRLPFKALIRVCPESWRLSYIYKFTGSYTAALFWFHTTIGCFDLNAQELTWLIYLALQFLLWAWLKPWI